VRAVLVVVLAVVLPLTFVLVAAEVDRADWHDRMEQADESVAGDPISEARTRSLRPLYDRRAELLFLTALVLPVGLLLAWWLGWRMTRPLEELRSQARLRAEQAARRGPLLPLDPGRRDEFGDLATSFNALLAALEERNATTASTTADLAHELKNPVAAIRSAAEALRRGPPDAARAERIGRILTDSSQRLDDVVTALLELSRAEAGLADQPRGTVDLAALIQGVTADLEDGEPRFELEGSGELVVRGAPQALESALRNLLSNAAFFADRRVHVRLERLPAGAAITVSDDGPGIPPDALPRVFDRFFTTRRPEGGTGLGLALVRAVAEAHEGDVSVGSPPGGGAVFRLWLPRR
jgi:signal transduction histidine kinase